MLDPHNSHPLTLAEDAHTGSVRKEVGAIKEAVENVTCNYLETLDALGTVYEAAAGIAQLFDTLSIAHFTLHRVLEALEVGCGAIFLESGGELVFHSDTEDALSQLQVEVIEDASLEGRPLFSNGSDAIRYLRPVSGSRNILLAPIVAAQRRLGIVVVLADQSRLLTTKDLKLVSAVTSQAAIALSGAQHFEQVRIERQKLHSIIDNSGGGIVVLAPDGRTMLTNVVARKMLGLSPDRAEGFSLVEELSHWKSSSDPRCLREDGPAEISLEIAHGSSPVGQAISVVGRRVFGANGELASTVLNLQDCTEVRRDEKMKEGLLGMVLQALRMPVESMDEHLKRAHAEDQPESTPSGHDLRSQLQPRVQELSDLAERLQCYVEVLGDSWTGQGRVDLSGIATETRARLVEKHAARSPQVELDLDPAAIQVGLSTRAAHLILENLLENAISFSRDEQPGVQVSTRRIDGETVSLIVEDHGAGVPCGLQQQLLTAYHCSSEPIPPELAWLGIRLALVHVVVRRVQGSIQVNPTRSGGTRLTLTLPSAPEAR